MQDGAIEGAIEPQGLIFDPRHELLLQRDEEVPREGARVTRRINTVDGLLAPRNLWIGGASSLAPVKDMSGLRFDVVELK